MPMGNSLSSSSFCAGGFDFFFHLSLVKFGNERAMPHRYHLCGCGARDSEAGYDIQIPC